MFDNTKNTLKEIGEKIKATGLIFKIIGQLFPIGYLVFLIAANIGSLTANIIFLVLSVLYFGFFLFMELRDFNKKTKKSVKKWVKIAYRWGKRIIRLLLIVIPSYGVVVTIQDFSPLALALLIFTILGIIWEIVWNILISVFKNFFRVKKRNFVSSFKRDFFNLRKKGDESDPNDFSDYGNIHEEK